MTGDMEEDVRWDVDFSFLIIAYFPKNLLF